MTQIQLFYIFTHVLSCLINLHNLTQCYLSCWTWENIICVQGLLNCDAPEPVIQIAPKKTMSTEPANNPEQRSKNTNFVIHTIEE